MRPNTRLEKIGKVLAARGPANQFHMVELTRLGSERAEGRPPGLYRDGPEGSVCGVLVYDPARGEPVIPEGRVTPFALVIECHEGEIEPPLEMP